MVILGLGGFYRGFMVVIGFLGLSFKSIESRVVFSGNYSTYLVCPGTAYAYSYQPNMMLLSLRRQRAHRKTKKGLDGSSRLVT